MKQKIKEYLKISGKLSILFALFFALLIVKGQNATAQVPGNLGIGSIQINCNNVQGNSTVSITVSGTTNGVSTSSVATVNVNCTAPVTQDTLPTASLQVKDVTLGTALGSTVTAKIGDTLQYVWLAGGGAVTASSTYIDGKTDTCSPINYLGTTYNWGVNSLAGTSTPQTNACQANNTYTITYATQNSSGAFATSTVKVQVVPAACKTLGQACDSTINLCCVSTACNGTNQCATCGGSGQLCCTGSTCNAGLSCNTSNTCASTAPQASVTINGLTSANVNVGDTVTWAWKSTSTSGSTYTADLTAGTGCPDTHGFVASTASGSVSGSVLSTYAGCTYTVHYKVTDSGNNTVTASASMIVNNPSASKCGTANGTTVSTAPASNILCAAGNTAYPSSVSGSGPWNWTCTNTTSASVACSANPPAVAACGSANNSITSSQPTTNLCGAGNTTSSVTGSGPWNWTCTVGGITANCQASPPSACTYTLDKVFMDFDNSAHPGNVGIVLTQSGCPWTLTSSAVWINNLQNNSGRVGSGAFTYDVDANLIGNPRSSTISGQTTLFVSQGIPCGTEGYACCGTSPACSEGTAYNFTVPLVGNMCYCYTPSACGAAAKAYTPSDTNYSGLPPATYYNGAVDKSFCNNNNWMTADSIGANPITTVPSFPPSFGATSWYCQNAGSWVRTYTSNPPASCTASYSTGGPPNPYTCDNTWRTVDGGANANSPYQPTGFAYSYNYSGYIIGQAFVFLTDSSHIVHNNFLNLIPSIYSSANCSGNTAGSNCYWNNYFNVFMSGATLPKGYNPVTGLNETITIGGGLSIQPYWEMTATFSGWDVARNNHYSWNSYGNPFFPSTTYAPSPQGAYNTNSYQFQESSTGTNRWWQFQNDASGNLQYNCGPNPVCINPTLDKDWSRVGQSSVPGGTNVDAYCDYSIGNLNNVSASINGQNCTLDTTSAAYGPCTSGLNYTCNTRHFVCTAPVTPGAYDVQCVTTKPSGVSDKQACNSTSTVGSIIVTSPPAANMFDSDKQIISVNGSPTPANSGNQCTNFVPLPSDYTVNTGDILAFRLDLCNDQGTASSTVNQVVDTMLNLQKPTAGYQAVYCFNSKCVSLTPAESIVGTVTTLTFTIPSGNKIIPGKVGSNWGGIATITYFAQVSAPSDPNAISSRFNNQFSINYNATTGYIPLNMDMGYIPFYSGKSVPTIKEVR